LKVLLLLVLWYESVRLDSMVVSWTRETVTNDAVQAGSTGIAASAIVDTL